MSTTNQSIRTLAEKLRAHAVSLHEARNKLRAERTELEQERADLLGAPLNRSDAIAMVFDYIDRRGAKFPEIAGWDVLLSRVRHPGRELGYGVSSQPNKPLSLEVADKTLQIDRANDESRYGIGGIGFITMGRDVPSFVRTFDEMAYFFFGDLIKEKLRPYIEAHMPELSAEESKLVGPPVAERRARLTEIAARLEEIASQDETLATELQEISAPSFVEPSNSPAADLCESKVARSEIPEEAINKYQRSANDRNLIAVAQEYRIKPNELLAAFHARERAARERFS